MVYLIINEASINGKLDIVNTLISANANLNIRDNQGYTALIWGNITILSID